MNQSEFYGKSILIADDEEYIRHHLAKKLKDLGLTVFEAGTGLEVMELAGRHPDMIILDVKMPALDGLETARRLKSDSSTDRIPLVLLSAMAQQDEVARGLATGADEYIMKPVTFNRLMDSIRGFIL